MLRRMVERSGRPLSFSRGSQPAAARRVPRHPRAASPTANAAGAPMTGQVAAAAGRRAARAGVHAQPVHDRTRVTARSPTCRSPNGWPRCATRSSARGCSQAADARSRQARRLAHRARATCCSRWLDEPDYEPTLTDSIGARAARARRDRPTNSPRRHARRRRQGPALPAVPELRRRQARRLPRDARPPAHRARPRRRRRPRRHDLRRQLPHHAARATGAATAITTGSRCRSSCSATAATPPRTVGLFDRGVLAPGLPRRPQRHRLRPAPAAQARDRPRPARRRPPAAAAGRRLRGTRSSPAR